MDLVACSKGFTSTIRYLTYVVNWVICIWGMFVAVVNIPKAFYSNNLHHDISIYIEYTMYVH